MRPESERENREAGTRRVRLTVAKVPDHLATGFAVGDTISYTDARLYQGLGLEVDVEELDDHPPQRLSPSTVTDDILATQRRLTELHHERQVDIAGGEVHVVTGSWNGYSIRVELGCPPGTGGPDHHDARAGSKLAAAGRLAWWEHARPRP